MYGCGNVGDRGCSLLQPSGRGCAGYCARAVDQRQGWGSRGGGSTITQQVARNLLMDSDQRTERTLRRKLRESALALELTRHYSRDEILALYLNQTYYGNLAYGVEAASQAYLARGG